MRALKILVAAGNVVVAGRGRAPALASRQSQHRLRDSSTAVSFRGSAGLIGLTLETPFTVHAGTATTATLNFLRANRALWTQPVGIYDGALSAVGSYDFAIFVNGSFADSVYSRPSQRSRYSRSALDGLTPQPIVGCSGVGYRHLVMAPMCR